MGILTHLSLLLWLPLEGSLPVLLAGLVFFLVVTVLVLSVLRVRSEIALHPSYTVIGYLLAVFSFVGVLLTVIILMRSSLFPLSPAFAGAGILGVLFAVVSRRNNLVARSRS